MQSKKEQLIKKTPCIAVFMDFCSSPFWEFHTEEGFSSCNLWEDDLYELIPVDLKQRFIDYQNEWEDLANDDFILNSDNSFELTLNDKIKSLAEDLKKSIPELRVFYVKYANNENHQITHSFEEVIFSEPLSVIFNENLLPNSNVLTDIAEEAKLWDDLYQLWKSGPETKQTN